EAGAAVWFSRDCGALFCACASAEKTNNARRNLAGLRRFAIAAGSSIVLASTYLLPFSLAGSPTNLLYSANSDGEQIICRTSKSRGCKSNRKLSRATQGFVYILGSSIVTVRSR